MAPRLAAVARRLDLVLSSRGARLAIATLNVVVLLVAAAPFALWEGLGPARFEGLELGQQPDLADVEPGAPLATPGDTARDQPWRASDLPYDLSPTTTVTLVFSVGSRGMGPDDAAGLRVHDVTDRGGDGLTDSMMLVVADRATRDVALLSLPRDLWVFARGHRINATYNRHGAQAFVDDVADATGLPVHHVVQVNFAAFARLIDAIGGVALPVDRALADVPAVLYVPEPGCWRFDGASALAWARSRHTRTLDAGGAWVADRTASDFGRIERQQALLGATWDKVRSPGTLTSLPELLGVARDGLVVDAGLGVQQLRDLMAAFSDVAAGRIEGHTLPTRGRRIGQAAAQVVEPAGATEVLTRLRTWPPGTRGASPAASPHRRIRHHDATLVAAPRTLPTDAQCTDASARPLPDPREPLWGVANNGRGPVQDPSSDQGSPGPGDPAEPVEPDGGGTSESPADPGPDASPTPHPTSDDGTQAPTPGPSPSPSESESDGSWPPIPLPG